MNCNVLIVDDSPIMRRAIRKVTRLAGIDDERISEAGNGQEAFDVLGKTPVDLVLLDLHMPIMDGEEFATKLREHDQHRDVRVVVVSTETNRDRLDRMQALGICGTLRKPFEPEELCKIISQTMGISQ